MEILKLVALFLGSALLLGACNVYETKNLNYQNKSFKAQIEWVSNGNTYIANLDAKKISSDQNENTYSRDVCLEYVSPLSLKGVRVERIGGICKVYLGDLEIIDTFEESLSIVDLFDVSGEVKNIIQTEETCVLEIIDGNNTYEVYLLNNSEYPTKIIGIIDNIRLEVKVSFFEILNEENANIS